jgi:hypothetical protein
MLIDAVCQLLEYTNNPKIKHDFIKLYFVFENILQAFGKTHFFIEGLERESPEPGTTYFKFRVAKDLIIRFVIKDDAWVSTLNLLDHDYKEKEIIDICLKHGYEKHDLWYLDKKFSDFKTALTTTLRLQNEIKKLFS